MKKTFYQWLIRTVLALSCLLTTTSTWAGFNIYVKPYSSNYYIHTWNGTIQTNNGSVSNSSWPGTQFNGNFNTKEIGGTTWYVVPVTTNSINYILNVGSDQHKTGDLYANSTIFVRYDENATAIEDVTSQYIDYLATWTVAGEPAELFGTAWDTGNTDNDMIETSNGILTWSKENVTLPQGTVKFKVCKNHGWDTAYPGSDYELNISSNGIYNVTITFRISNHEVNASATLIQTTPEAPTFSPAGGTYNSNQSVTLACSTSEATIYYTTDGSEPTTSSTVYSGAIVLNSEGTTTIKAIAVKNGHSSSVAEATYTIDYDNFTVAGATNNTSDGTEDVFFGTSWNSNANPMTTANGVDYTWASTNQVTLNEGNTVAFKIVKKGAEDEWIGADGNNIVLTAPNNGVYTLTVNYTVNRTPEGILTCVTTLPDFYVVAGNNADIFGSAWDVNNNRMTQVDGVWTWSSSATNLTGGASVAFKVVKNGGVQYIPDGGEETNIVCTADHGTGSYILTVTYNEGEAPVGTLSPLFVTTPVFSPAPGTYDSNQDVTITAASGTIYYTTDGSDPTTSSTRQQYSAPIPMHHEDNFTFKAVAVDGNEVSAVAEADYTIKYVNIYLFGSVGKQHTWLYSYTNPEMTTSDGVNYYGVFDILNMPTYTDREGAGLFLLTTGFGTNWETTQQYMIGTTASNNFWIDGDHNYLGEWVDAAPVGQSDKGWTIIPPSGHGTYEFFYNRQTNQFKLAAFDGPTIYVYDFTRPYIYVKDGNNVEFNGEMPGNPIQILDESVGGHSGLSHAADGSGLGNGTLGWYKFAVPSHDTPITFQFYHNNDKTVVPSGLLTDDTTGDVYYYWDGEQYVKLNSREDAANLRRIVAHVRVQGTTVPTCDNQPMNGPSSFYGQMYYWMAVTKFNAGERMVITDGTHHYDQTITSDVYLEWTDEQDADYVVLSNETLEHRLANKTGRGTIIHLQKNRNTPPTKEGNVVGIDTKVQDGDVWTNTTNLGTTWWGTSLDSPWKGAQAWTDGVLSNYDNSRYLYMENGLNGNPDVYIVTAEDGTEWYTWYCDRSTATIRFGYGEGINGYPTYTNNKEQYKFFAHYESDELHQNAGELWYVWTPDFDATLENGQSRDNGEILDVTRMYESSAKQKALCSTFRDGNYVYYTDIKGWGDDNVYCYVWSVPGIDWPGIKMVKVGYDDEGHPVYLADLSNYDVTNAEGILFNNGVTDSHATNKRQTGNLEWVNHGCYDYLGLIYRIGGNIDVIENEPDGENSTLVLRGVWYSRVKGTLFAKGDNDYNNKSVNSRGYIDFAKMETSAGVLQSWDYDQSNWVEIEPSESVSADDLKALLEQEFTLYGTKLSSVNPRFKAISISNQHNTQAYKLNHFTPAHFNGTCFQQRRGDNEWYFFVEPKPNEFAEIDWTIFNEGAFYAYKNAGFDGTINVDWSYHDPGYSEANMTSTTGLDLSTCGIAPDLFDMNGYTGWLAIIKLAEETPASTSSKGSTGTQFDEGDVSPSTNKATKYTVYPILLNDDFVTTIETINTDKANGMRTLKCTRYYNMMGIESSTPFQGVNIIVKEYTDGSRESSKVIIR